MPNRCLNNLEMFQITKGGIVSADPPFTADFPGSGPRHVAIDESRSELYKISKTLFGISFKTSIGFNFSEY